MLSINQYITENRLGRALVSGVKGAAMSSALSAGAAKLGNVTGGEEAYDVVGSGLAGAKFGGIIGFIAGLMREREEAKELGDEKKVKVLDKKIKEAKKKVKKNKNKRK